MISRNKMFLLLLVSSMALAGCKEQHMQSTVQTPVGKELSSRFLFEDVLLSGDYTYPTGVDAADIDGDGDMDIVSSDALPHNKLYLYKQDKGQFVREIMEPHWTDRLERLKIVDLDNDGSKEVVIVNNKPGQVLAYWHKNGKWERSFVSQDFPSAYEVDAADFDGDKKLEVVSIGRVGTPQEKARFSLFHQHPDGKWQEKVLEEGLTLGRAAEAGDLNQDGKPDVLSVSAGSGQIKFYANCSSKVGDICFKPAVLIDKIDTPMHVFFVDMDGDQDLDFVITAGYPETKKIPEFQGVLWYENIDKASRWEKHTVGQLYNAAEAVAADVDKDGDMDIFASSHYRNDAPQGYDIALVLFENVGDFKFDKQVVKHDWMRAVQVLPRDIDQDGNVDFLALSTGANEARVLYNRVKK